MSVKNIQSKLNRKRYFKEKVFRFYGIIALVISFLFLLTFFGNMFGKGYSALRQAKIYTTITITPEVLEDPAYAFPEEDYYFVSRDEIRRLPLMIQDSKGMMNKTFKEWVTADSEVDQYLKGKPSRLKNTDKKHIDKLKEEGRVRLFFNWGFFTNGDSNLPEIAGIKAAMFGTIYVMIITILVSVPIGIATAIYLEEYAKDNFLTRIIEVNINNLAAIPSIIYGLLGLAIFINFFHVPRSSALAGGLTLGIMNLPVIVISARAAIKSVPPSIREAAYGVGASKLQVIWHHILPLAIPGILTGFIIGLARSIGETAPLLIVGMVAYIPDAPSSFTQSTTVLPAQIYNWSTASLRAFTEKTALAILVLLTVMLFLNAIAIWLRNKYEKQW
ncbi:MAG: phosphate transporter, inner rane subunit PstA [Deferribacteraceae bacterium]|jgi:phosphate transport system permease protein|nr:phosphate transporter, inner rane subunit PstA [Deferribacteraceae bacterium]